MSNASAKPNTMSIIITFDEKGARVDGIRTLLEKTLQTKYPDATIHITRKDPPTTRPKRFIEAQAKISDAKNEFESLRDELQEWKDNLPENLQNSSKADALQTAIDELEQLAGELDDVENADVEFPSMY